MCEHHHAILRKICILFSLFYLQVTCQPNVIKIGAIFEGADSRLESVFRQSVDMVNIDKTRLPGTRLEALVARINHRDSFHASKAACQLIESGVWALFGPQSPSVGWLIRSISDNLHIPGFQFNWDYRSYHRHKTFPSNMTINLHPEPSRLSQAFADFVESRNWKSFAVVYEVEEDLIKVKDLLKLSVPKIMIKQLPSSTNDYRKMFKDIKKSKEPNIVLSIGLDKVNETLISARDIGLMTVYNNYLIASLDIKQLDLSEFTRVNISGLSLHAQSVGKLLSVEEALLSDSVYLFAKAMDDLQETQSVTPPSLTCQSRTPWAYGSILMNIMRVVNIRALTGFLKFDAYGRRSDFDVDILELRKEAQSFRRVGTWNAKTKISIIRNTTEEGEEGKEQLRNKTLRVTAPVNAEPYIWFKDDHMNRTGNDRFEGFCVDLLYEIAEFLGCNFEIFPIPGNDYGSLRNGEWGGMMRELMDLKADLGICDLTITADRQSAVDFTLPFMSTGISIVYKKPELEPPDLFSFMKPFSVEVWLYMATAFLGVTLLLYTLSRLSPYEWMSGHPCDDDPEELENQFSLGNCMWFALGCIMQQGSDLAPRALSTRTLASVWAFFTLIIISSYTANLAAFLTVSRMAIPINNAEDLAKQTKIQYGAKFEGSTYNFFKTSNHSTYERMWSTMESTRPSVFVNSNSAGVERAKKGGYAFLMEQASIEYEVQRNCDLQQIGGSLDQKGYGIATPPESPFRGFLNDAILELQEKGRLAELKKRWWKDRVIEKGIICPDDSKPPGMELDVGNVGGVFVVLIIGLGIGIVLGIIEFIWKTKKVARHERDHAAVMMGREVVRICRGGGGHRVTESSTSSSSRSTNSKRSASRDEQAVVSSLHASGSSNINNGNGRVSETASRHNQINEVNVRINAVLDDCESLMHKKTTHVYFSPPDPTMTDLRQLPHEFFRTNPSPSSFLLPNGMNHHINHFACHPIPSAYFTPNADQIPLSHMNGFFVTASSSEHETSDGFLLTPIHTIPPEETAAFLLPDETTATTTLMMMQQQTLLLSPTVDSPAVIEEGASDFLLPSHSSHQNVVYRETSC